MSEDSSYSRAFLDHYRRPRHLGDLPDADAVGVVHERTCGDVMRIALQRDGELISAARFKAHGCAAAIASGSVTTVMVTGMELEAAARLEVRDIVIALGGLPPSRLHAAALAISALRRALDGC